MKEKKNGKWTNVSKLQTVQPAKYYLPETYDDIVAAILEAEAKHWRIRAVGAGHSSTDIAISQDILLDMSRLCKVAEADRAQLKASTKGMHLAHMQAGANIAQFNDALDALDLAFPTLGIIDNQTISGAVATGTHGNVPTLPGFGGLVRSMLLVAAGGKKYRIEPAGGITDPALHREKDVQLIQNDDTFYSALLHVGAFGIIGSYIMEVEPQYWLMEKRTVEKWSNVRKEIENNTLFRDYPIRLEKEFVNHPVLGINMALNPHEIDGDHTIMVARFFKLAHKPHRSILEATRSIGTNIVVRTMIPYAVLINQANKHPEKLPKTLDGALHLMNEESYINKSYKVWYQGLEFIVDMTFGSEFAFNGDNAEWLKAVDAIFATYKDLRVNHQLAAPNTLMMRFTKGAKAYLAPEGGYGVAAWVGNPVPRQMDRGMEVLEAFQETCMANGGKSHWGKMNNRVAPKPALLKAWFPKMDVWKKEMRKFNPNNTFSNTFTDRFGLTK
jgi:L-gulono-1,4-lactone dehydrogenase